MSRTGHTLLHPGGIVACACLVLTAARAEAQATTGDRPAADTAASGSAVVSDQAPPASPVATPAGSRRRVEVGGAVAEIGASDVVRRAPIRNVADLLTARVAGVDVRAGVQTGAGMRVRIRGIGSPVLSAEPLYLVDGIRMLSTSGSDAFAPSTGGGRPTRVDDLNVEDIDRIEILRGPATAALYGTDAANGVVLITTKRGQSGEPRWTVLGEAGRITDRAAYPMSFTAEGHAFDNPAARLSGGACTLANVGSPLPSRCVIDSVRSYSVFRDPEATPLGTGNRYRTGVQLSGGSPALRYFVAGARENESGPLTLPPFELARLSSAGGIAEHERHPNTLGRTSARANVDASIGRTLDLGVSAGYVDLDQRFAGESDLVSGVGFAALYGPGYAANGTSQAGNPLHGYFYQPPGELFHTLRGQAVRRVMASANATWRPMSWWSTRVTGGTDRAEDTARESFAGVAPSGFVDYLDYTRSTLRLTTAEVVSTVSASPRAGIASRTSMGAQLVWRRRDMREEFRTATAASPMMTAEESVWGKTRGYFLQEELAVRDRLFVNGAIRTDQVGEIDGAFRRFDPSMGVSWVVPRTGLLGRLSGMEDLRLRAAYGVSTTVPRDPTLPFVGARPERSSELEGGVDARLLAGRAHAELTAYRKRARDVLVSPFPPPPSGLGFPPSVPGEGGVIANDGVELSVGGVVAKSRSVELDITIVGSANRNRLVSLGASPPQIGIAYRVRPGYPLYGYWERPLLGYADRNGDGLITSDANPALSEVTVGDTAVFIGSVDPTRSLAVAPALDLFGKRLRVTSLFDYRGGQYLYNQTAELRCSAAICAGRQDPGASLFEQARAVARFNSPVQTSAGYIEPASFTRWRELSVTLDVSETLATRYLRARRAAVSLSGRNLRVWTSYTGVDPEADSYAGAGESGPADLPREQSSLAPPTYYSVRVDLVF